MDGTLSKTKNKKLTRYRITLDVMIDRTSCEPPTQWNWKDLMELEGKEQVNDVYIENLGEYKI